MTHNKLSKVRHFALALVLGNLALVGALAIVLPEGALAALPVLALMLPLLSAAAIEAAIAKQPSDREKKNPARAPRLSFGRALFASS